MSVLHAWAIGMPQLASFKELRHQWSKIPVSYRGGLILAIPAVCTIAVLLTWSELRHEAIAVHEEIGRSESSLKKTNDLLQLLPSAAIGIRGYVITQQADFLEPYERAVAELPSCLKQLKQLHYNNTSQKQSLNEITTLVQQELDLLDEALNSERKNSEPERANLLRQSKQKISQISNKTNDFRSKEWTALQTKRDRLFEVREATNIAFCSAAIISLLSFLAALYLFKLLEEELNEQQKNLRSRATELADLNQALARTNKTLAERNSELDRFSHIVSHDLKAPLRGIGNLSKWIEEDLADNLTPETQRHLHLQRERIARMENLIDGLLQYARVGTSKAEVEIDIRQLLEEVIDSISPPPEFEIAIVGKMPIINTQRLHLEQVFSNLIANAVKHHPRTNGKITVSVREHEHHYEFAVADDGAGIAPILQKRIFDIFHSLNQEDKSNTGVGLAIVKRIVEEHSGEITVMSEVGKGSTFCFQWLKQ